MPIGAKTLFHVECFDGAGHAIMVSKEGTDSFGVCDINLNNGSKVIYTALEFKQLMNAEATSITGKDAITGADITRNIYYKATNDYGKISFITSSENVEEMLQIAA